MTPAPQASSSDIASEHDSLLARAVEASGLGIVGGVAGAIGTIGAVILPLTAMQALSQPMMMGGEQFVGGTGAVVLGGMGVLAIPAAKAALRGAIETTVGPDAIERLGDSRIARLALAASEKLGGLRGAVTVAATAAAGLAAATGIQALTGSHDLATGAMLMAGTAVLAAGGTLDGLRKARQQKAQKARSHALDQALASAPRDRPFPKI